MMKYFVFSKNKDDSDWEFSSVWNSKKGLMKEMFLFGKYKDTFMIIEGERYLDLTRPEPKKN